MNITSPRQLIHAIPEIFRDVQDQSLLLVTLINGTVADSRGFPTASGADLDEATSEFLSLGQSNDEVALVAIAYGVSHEQAESVLHTVRLRTEESGLHVLDLLHLWDGRWRSVLCSDEECCPRNGHLVTSPTEVGTETESANQNETSTVDSDFTFEFANLKADEVLARDTAFANLPQYPNESATELLEIRNARVQEAVHLLSTQEQMEWDALARTCSVIADIRCRDGILRQIFENEESRPDLCRGLSRILAVAPEDHRASVATTLAGALWLDGHRAVTRKLIALALEADETYSLARLLDTALQHGVPHRVWVDSLAAVAYEKCLVGAA